VEATSHIERRNILDRSWPPFGVSLVDPFGIPLWVEIEARVKGWIAEVLSAVLVQNMNSFWESYVVPSTMYCFKLPWAAAREAQPAKMRR
jgi:hypothetical protein